MKRKITALSLACIMAFSMCACSQKTTEETAVSAQKTGQETKAEEKAETGESAYRSVTVALTTSSFDLSPFGADGGSRDIMKDNLYGYLACMPSFGLSFDELVGDLAKSMTLSDDGLTCTVELYDYIHDSKGNDITAEDVVFSYNYAIGLSGRNDFTRVASYMKSIEAVDDYTVKITANSTGVGVMETLVCVIPIVNKEWFESASDEEKTSNPAVTGSYYIADLVSDASVTMKKVEDYWQTDDSLRTYLNHQPVDEIVYTVITESAMRTIALENNEVDTAQISASEAYRFIDDDGNALDGWSATRYPSSRFMALMFNCSPGSVFTDNQQLRQAVCYAIDAGQVMIGAGETEISATPCKDFGSSLAGDYVQEWNDESYYDYDLDKAKELMAEAGYKEGDLKLRLMITNLASRLSGAAVVQAQLAAIGIDVEIISYDNALWSTYKTDFTQWDLLIDSYSTTGYCPDAWNRLDHGDRNGVQDDKLQQLYEDSMNIHTEESLKEFHDYLKEQAYAYGLYETYTLMVAQEGIEQIVTGRTANIEVPAYQYAADYQSVVQ